MNRMNRKILLCKDLQEISHKAADTFVDLSHQAIQSRKRFAVALSGGKTPKALYSLLATEEYRNKVSWNGIQVFWGDERCVPPSDDQSNYKMANESLLQHVSIPSENIHRIPAELPDHNRAAEEYEQEIKTFFSAETALPRFDLILLGMGDEGHTASLFPGTAAMQETNHLVVPNYVEKFGTFRITFTYPLINNAETVLFLITGADKAPALKEVLEGKQQPELYPAQKIQPENGNLLYFIDRDAASLLSKDPNS